MRIHSISRQTLQRLPVYLNYLKSLPKEGPLNISATTIAGALGLNDVQVRKDLASISSGGRPKIGYIIEDLRYDIEHFLGYHDVDSAIIVGAGNLGRALLSYDGFSEYGLKIVAAFDKDDSLVDTLCNGKKIFPVSKLKDLCSRMNIRIGIITVPTDEAQTVCDLLIESGIIAIWNFAPAHLIVPKDVLVQNENIAFSLATLSNYLTMKLLED